MRLVLIDDDGTVLDSEEVTREDMRNLSPMGAYALLSDLQIPKED